MRKLELYGNNLRQLKLQTFSTLGLWAVQFKSSVIKYFKKPKSFSNSALLTKPKFGSENKLLTFYIIKTFRSPKHLLTKLRLYKVAFINSSFTLFFYCYFNLKTCIHVELNYCTATFRQPKQLYV